MPPGAASPDMGSMEEMLAAQGGQAGTKTSSTSSSHSASQNPPRHATPIGSPLEEARNIAGGVGTDLYEFLPPILKNMISSKPEDTPEEAAKKRQMLQNYQKLTADEQQYVHKKLQEEEMEKRRKEEEEQIRRQQEAAAQSSEMAVPEGKKTGEAAMGGGKSQKSQTISKLQNDRKKMSSSG